MRKRHFKNILFYKLLFCLLICHTAFAQDKPKINGDSLFIAENYDKAEYRVPMRDGITLFTVVYAPKDKNAMPEGRQEKYPILFLRTPYSVGPYGEGKMKETLGPAMKYAREKFIFAYQDVRGRFMSGGEFVNVRPYIPDKKSNRDIDETTDTYDAIDWLVKNIPGNNGRVGMWGISYPGFYASMGIIDAHPALVAASPQAPIADWFRDDFFHYGAFFLPHAFNFFYVFGRPRPDLTTQWGKRFTFPSKDGYGFFLKDVGPLKYINPMFYKDSVAFWNDITGHPNDDLFWKARNILPRLKNIRPATLVVGGWYDAEDLYGTLNTYQAIEIQNPPLADNRLVMGPWRHGGWARDNGSKLGNIFFGDAPPPSKFFLDSVEFPFFLFHLKDKEAVPKAGFTEAIMFETGKNRWRRFNAWPPVGMQKRKIYLAPGHQLSFELPETTAGNSFDDILSDPSNPVPYTETITTEMTKEYMTDDQRFASGRPDVLWYKTAPLTTDLTLAGKMVATLYVSTTGTDADWIVKVIDVFPDSAKNFAHNPPEVKMAGYQQMVRSEVFRGKFRNGLDKPEPFIPGKISEVQFELQDVLHTFIKGHALMIQIQNTWFPLVDRNPQKYVENIFFAGEEDFIKATNRVFHSKDNASCIEVGVIK